MIWKSRTVSRSYLFCAGIALLISTPTYTYRAVILVAYFYLVWRESSLFEEEVVGTQLGKDKISPDIDRRNESLNSGLKPERLVERLKSIREYAWLPILAPTTIFFYQWHTIFRGVGPAAVSPAAPACYRGLSIAARGS